MFTEKLTRLFGGLFHKSPKYITVSAVSLLDPGGTPIQALPPAVIPKHVAIIMDGNGRWANARHLPRSAGHAAGVEALREIIKAADEWGIQFLTIYAFSTENWARDKEEVEALMSLLLKYFSSEIDELHRKNVCIRILGDVDGLPEAQRNAVTAAMAQTAANTGLHLNIALNYGGRAELLRSVRTIAENVANGSLNAEDITEEIFGATLYTAGQPDVDLLIRTSGEMRLSNFLPWQSTYAEMVFDKTLWPDFDRTAFKKAIDTFASRKRLFGGNRNETASEAEV